MVEYSCEPGRWVYLENFGVWGMGAWKMTKNPLFWLQRICCCIPLRLVFTLQDRTSGKLHLVWLEALWKGYRGYSAAISGTLWLSGKIKSNIRCMGGWVVHRLCLSRSAIGTSGELDLVVGVYGGVPLRARKVGISGKLCFMGNGGLKMIKNPLFWLQRIWCCIPLRLVFTLQDRTSDDIDLVWLEAL